MREKVVRHFIDLVEMQNELCHPVFHLLRSAFRNGTIILEFGGLLSSY
jgi:hypothetical protein